MTTRKPTIREIEPPTDERSEADILHEMEAEKLTPEEEAEQDAWFERNKDILRESFRRAEEEFARGEGYTLEEVEAHLDADKRKRIRQKQNGSRP